MNNMDVVERFSAVTSGVGSAVEFCRTLVHDEVFGGRTLGAQLFVLTDRGMFSQIASYGLEGLSDSGALSLFTHNPLSQAVNARALHIEPCRLEGANHEGLQQLGSLNIRVLPLAKDALPIGALLFLYQVHELDIKVDESVARTMSNIGGLYLSSLGPKGLFRESTPSSDELTSRQYEVLLGMARGETNAQIARHLILSESSIKSEALRIYRVLGVSSREQAVAKARATGLIPEGVQPIKTALVLDSAWQGQLAQDAAF
jgi:DNA-binding CsgD family transcriptional regulator